MEIDFLESTLNSTIRTKLGEIHINSRIVRLINQESR